MFDMEARHVIEALRSGVPSRAVGEYFSEARPVIMKDIVSRMNTVTESGKSSGMVITGKYGEGKTHLLNTVFNIAHSQNMVVSYLSLSKETPMDKLYLIYQKAIANTYLPQRLQPGFASELNKLTANSPVGNEMLLYAVKQLESDKLYFLLRSYLNTEDPDEKFLLQADMEGDFIANPPLKKIYKRIFNQTAKMNVNFSKTKHCGDYFAFMSHLFVQLGYHGWVILIDETELMGRLGRKARLNAYRNMKRFLFPDSLLESTFSLFALSASYGEDVIEGKHEYENLQQLFPEEVDSIGSVLERLAKAPQLLPLNKEELQTIFERVVSFHGRAYEWQPDISPEHLMKISQTGGYLLRTRIRSAIEYLDQMYLYGDSGDSRVEKLEMGSFDEDIPSLEELNV